MRYIYLSCKIIWIIVVIIYCKHERKMASVSRGWCLMSLSLVGWCNCFPSEYKFESQRRHFFTLDHILLTVLNVTGTTHSSTAPFPIIPSCWQAGCICKVAVHCLSRTISHQTDIRHPWRNTEHAHSERKYCCHLYCLLDAVSVTFYVVLFCKHECIRCI